MANDTTGNGIANVINRLTNLGTKPADATPNAPRTPLQRNMRGPSQNHEELMSRLNINPEVPSMDSSDDSSSDEEETRTISIPVTAPKKPRGRPKKQ